MNRYNNLYPTNSIKYENNSLLNDNLYTQNALYLFISVTVILTIILCFAYIIKRIKIEKGEYKRDTNNIIDPILAESIIDGKINAKDLIMTCLVNMIHNNKIQNIDNDRIKLLSVDGLSDIEQKIVHILFSADSKYLDLQKLAAYGLSDIEQKKVSIKFSDDSEYSDLQKLAAEGKIIKISSLENIFKEKNNITLDIYEEFLEIKKMIKRELKEQNILSGLWDIVLKQVRIISAMLIGNMLIVLFAGHIIFTYASLKFKYCLILLNLIIYISANNYNPRRIINMESHRKKGGIAVLIIYIFIMMIESIINNRIDMKLLLVYTILIIINILIFIFSKIYVFTEKGKKEYSKAFMLKKYLQDYSLMQKRDMDGIIIFDEYLIYATAFGISSTITRKINENLMNMNIGLQIISRILTL